MRMSLFVFAAVLTTWGLAMTVSSAGASVSWVLTVSALLVTARSSGMPVIRATDTAISADDSLSSGLVTTLSLLKLTELLTAWLLVGWLMANRMTKPSTT